MRSNSRRIYRLREQASRQPDSSSWKVFSPSTYRAHTRPSFRRTCCQAELRATMEESISESARENHLKGGRIITLRLSQPIWLPSQRRNSYLHRDTMYNNLGRQESETSCILSKLHYASRHADTDVCDT